MAKDKDSKKDDAKPSDKTSDGKLAQESTSTSTSKAKTSSSDKTKKTQSKHSASGSGNSSATSPVVPVADAAVISEATLADSIAKVMGQGFAQLSKSLDDTLGRATQQWMDFNSGFYDCEGVGFAEDEPEVDSAPFCQDGGALVPGVASIAADSLLSHTVPDPQTTRKTSAKDLFLGNLTTADDAEVLGDPLASETLAARITALMRNKPSADFDKEGLKKFLRPGNCEGLSPIRINETIWPELPKSAQSADANMQRTQLPLLKGGVALARITDIFLANFDDSTNAVSLDEETTSLIFSYLNQGLGCIGAANYELVQRRKERLRSEINTDYSHICSPSHPFTEWLFGNDINQKVEDISTSHKISKKVVKAPSTARGSHRGRGQASGRGQPYYRGGFHPYASYGYSGQPYQGYRGRGRGNFRGRPWSRGRGSPFLGPHTTAPASSPKGQNQQEKKQ